MDDPFKRLGPIAIFSARRHWTAPRNVRLQKGSSKPAGATDTIKRGSGGGQCNCKRTMTYSSTGDLLAGRCEVCSKYTMHGASIAADNLDASATGSSNIDNGGIEYGFHLRGDAPVIVSYVEHNSLADVSFLKIKVYICFKFNIPPIIF